MPNQDAVAHRPVEIGRGQIEIIAVADGAGSAQCSDEGSRIAVDTAVATMATGLSKRSAAASSRHQSTPLVRNAVKRAKNAVAWTPLNTTASRARWRPL